MNVARIATGFFLLLITQVLLSQQVDYSKTHLHPPLDIPIYLSGTFGELRSNHFHSGIDMKTQGLEGLPVYAAEAGYVSRIKVALNGYGKVIYITHPNGYVTVYGHLQKFNDQIQEYVKTLQYKNESFTMQCFPSAEELPVKKGEVIAWSGNSGSSSAPHLHYEVREARSQHPVNPLFFDGIAVKDELRPKIIELAIYPVDQEALINGKNDTVFYLVAGTGPHCHLAGKPVIPVSGRLSFGLRVYDPMNGIGNRNGVYKLEMLLDTKRVFKIEMDKISFATTRYLNSLIDYHYYQKSGRRLIRTQVDTNNRLFNYRDVETNGIFSFEDTQKHQISFIVEDAYGNQSVFTFKIQSVLANPVKSLAGENRPANKGTWFDFSKENKYYNGNLSIAFPPNAFYRSFYFHLDSAAKNDRTYAPLYKIHNKYTPVHKTFTMHITPSGYAENIKDKLFIAMVNDNGIGYAGSEWDGNQLKADSRLFGNYTVMADTIAPQIEPINLWENKNLGNTSHIRLKIRDDATGIDAYRPTLNGEWILMEYETKNNTITYQIDERAVPGENVFRLEVNDKMGNATVYEETIIR